MRQRESSALESAEVVAGGDASTAGRPRAAHRRSQPYDENDPMFKPYVSALTQALADLGVVRNLRHGRQNHKGRARKSPNLQVQVPPETCWERYFYCQPAFLHLQDKAKTEASNEISGCTSLSTSGACH